MNGMSIVIPARNEERLIAGTIEAVLASQAYLKESLQESVSFPIEFIVVDNDSHDRTAEIAQRYSSNHSVRLLRCHSIGSAHARNVGFRMARGDILVTIDADTRIPQNALKRIYDLVYRDQYRAGIFKLVGDHGNVWDRLWWTFWEHVRRLPLAYAKAMPAFMFCTKEAFEQFGPFDGSVQIGEEWPILAGCYKESPKRFIYDRSIAAITSSRRMEYQTWGYTRTFLKYVWAILHKSGRNGYTDTIR